MRIVGPDAELRAFDRQLQVPAHQLQLLVLGRVRRTVAEGRREQAPAGDDDLEDGELDRKDAAVLAQAFGLDPLAEHLGLAAGDIGGKAVPMGVAQMLGHDQVGDRPAGRFLAAIAEHRLGGRIHRQDAAVLVDHDDPVQRRGDDRRLDRLEFHAFDHSPFPAIGILTGTRRLEPRFISALTPLAKNGPGPALAATIETLFPGRRHRPETALFHKSRIAARSGGRWRSEMTTNSKKRSRLQLVLVLAAALGSSSATLSGALATLATQHSTGSQAEVA